MFLKTLKLLNFRNYAKLNFKFDPEITVLVGKNAQGKSNFLESIYYLATTKSAKAEKEEELIKGGENFLRVEGTLGDELSLEVVIQVLEGSFSKTVKVNGIPKRISDYSGNLAVVIFSPEDINLVTGSPALRRGHIDQVLSQISKDYKKTHSSYEEVVTKKNRVLKKIKDGFGKLDELIYWSDQQVLLGESILMKRREFFDFLNTTEKRFGDFEFEYLENSITTPRLQEYQSREIDAATSLIGPHRDDFLFKLKGQDLAKFGSRGEQRTAVLDLKMSEVSFIEDVLKDRPILLLDDIFSELDLEHRKHVVDLAKLQQTVIASIELDKFLKEQFKEAQIVQVDNRKINSFSGSGQPDGKAGKLLKQPKS